MRLTKPEWSGLRCEKISRWHRELGFNFPAIDLDFILVEFHLYEPAALIEYKHENAAPLTRTSPGVLVLQKLADRAGLPAFVVRYSDDLQNFHVTAINRMGTIYAPTRLSLSAQDFSRFLENLREKNFQRDADEAAA